MKPYDEGAIGALKMVIARLWARAGELPVGQAREALIRAHDEFVSLLKDYSEEQL
jgi:hypothetical protein